MRSMTTTFFIVFIASTSMSAEVNAGESVDPRDMVYGKIVHTPKGTPFVAYYALWDYSVPVQEEMTAKIRALFPKAYVVAPPSRLYNCHSFAWRSEISSSGSIEVDGLTWINTPGEKTYWRDGSYRERPKARYPRTSFMRVRYRRANHSAMVFLIRNQVWFFSKWGSNVLMLHRPGYDPYYKWPSQMLSADYRFFEGPMY